MEAGTPPTACADLGLPQENCVPSPAGPSTDTCDKNCQFTGDTSACEDNLLGTVKTSGYLHYHTLPIPGVDKCSYGSKLDEGTTNGLGGINKATSTNCFSPHASLHDESALMAIEV